MIRRANLDDDSLDKLALNIADKMYEANCQVFSLDKDTDAAFYLVREGCIKLIRKDGSGTIISAGGYFGQEQLLVDCNRCSCRPDHSVCTRVPAEYTATAVEKSLLGVLSLDDCRHVFDTRI